MTKMTWPKKITYLSIVALVISLGYHKWSDMKFNERLQSTMVSLLMIESSNRVTENRRISVGYGSCMDLVAKTDEILFKNFNPPEEGKHHNEVNDLDQLLELFAYFFNHGAAAERFINNTELFAQFVTLANSVDSTKTTIGGNAPIMAIRFAKEGISKVHLGAQMSEKLRSLLPKQITVSGEIEDKDDIHLLLEYSAGDTWKEQLISPRANRLIIHNDHKNPLLSSMESFNDELVKFKPHLYVIGGLHMMDNYPDPNNERPQRLKRLGDFIKTLLSEPANKIPRIHFEMASFTDETLLSVIKDEILPHVDSFGLNEQELPNLLQFITMGNTTLVSNAYPRVATSLDEMRDLYVTMHKGSNGSRLSRIHLHTLAFQAILTRKSTKWPRSRAAAAKSALTAYRHTCGSQDIDIAKAKLIMDDSFTTTKTDDDTIKKRIAFDSNNPVTCWDEEIIVSNDDDNGRHVIEFCVAPVLVCTKVLQTGGGGDNVSAAGLVLQL